MPFDLDSSYLFYFCAAVSVVLVVEAIYLLLFSRASYRSRVNRRLRLLKDEPDRQNVLVQLRRERGLTSAGGFGLSVHWINRLVLQSGLTIGIWRFVVVIACVTLLVFVFLFVWRGDLLEAALGAFAGATLLPYLTLAMMRRRRHAKFGEQFPDAIDIIVRSLRAGHPVPVAIAMVARELRDPIGTEFGIVTDEITYGADLETAMRNLAFRVGQEDLPLFVTAIAIQSSTGGNLSEILGNLSAVIRQRFKMRRKIHALAAEGRFSAFFLSGLPFAIFFLLNIVAPDFYGSVMDQQATKIGLGGALGWMAIGNLFMRRMINFRI